MENIYSIEDAGKKLGGISKHTVAAWLNQGKLQRIKVGRRTMITESELVRFLALGKNTPPIEGLGGKPDERAATGE